MEMSVSSLLKTASKQVAQHCKDGTISLDVAVPELPSNLIFSALTEDYRRSSVDCTKLLISKAKFETYSPSYEDMKFISNLELKKLELNTSLKNAAEKGNTYEDTKASNKKKVLKGNKSSLHFLCDCLRKSHQSLTYLAIKLEDDDENWLNELLNILKNVSWLVVTTDIWYPFSRANSYLKLDKFTQVTVLDISDCYLNNLDGISQLSELAVLIMFKKEFDKADDIDDLFNLRKLRHLIVSSCFGIISQLVEKGKTMVALEFIECCNTDITFQSLTRLLDLNRTINKIVLYRTPLAAFTRNNLTVLSTNNWESAVMTLKHFKDNKRCMFIHKIQKDLYELLEKKKFFQTEQSAKEYLDLLLEQIEKNVNRYDKHEWPLRSVVLFCKKFHNHLTNEKKKQIVSLLVNSPDTDFSGYAIFGELDIILAPGLDIPSLYQRGLEFFNSMTILTDVHHEGRVLVIKGLKVLQSMIPSSSRLQITSGREDYMENLSTAFFEQTSTLMEDEEKFYSFCQSYREVLLTLITDSKLPCQSCLVNSFISHTNSESSFVKMIFLECAEKVMYRLTIDEVNSFARSSLQIKYLMECLLGDFSRKNEKTDTHEERCSAIYAMKIMAIATKYFFENQVKFVEKLCNLAIKNNYTVFHIPTLKNDNKANEETYPVKKANNLMEWATSIHEDLLERVHLLPNIRNRKKLLNYLGDLLPEEPDRG